MLKSFDFSITKSSTCELTICDLIDTQTAPAGNDEIRYDLVIPAVHSADITEITSIDVVKNVSCDDSFNPIEFSILPLNGEPGDLAYSTLTVIDTTELLTFTHNGYTDTEIANISKITLNIKRAGEVVLTEDLTVIPSGAISHKFMDHNIGTNGVTDSLFRNEDIAEIVVTYNNGVTTTATWDIVLGVGSPVIGGAFTLTYNNDMTVTSPSYSINNSDCLELTTDSDTFGDENGIWSVRLTVNYLDSNGDPATVTTVRCASVDCDIDCDAIQTIATQLKSNPDLAFELALAKQAIEWAMECGDCCAACDAFALYSNRSQGNCNNC